jgi:hypothetical protein
MVYKQLQQQNFPPLRSKQYTPPAQVQRYQQTQPGMTVSRAIKQYTSATVTQAPTANQPNPTPHALAIDFMSQPIRNKRLKRFMPNDLLDRLYALYLVYKFN